VTNWKTILLYFILLLMAMGCKSTPKQEPATEEPNNIFRWTPTFEQAGEYLVTFRVSDGNSVTEETIVITVEDVGYDGRRDWLEDEGKVNLYDLARLKCPGEEE